jgi:hypothetical protein
MFHIHKYVSGKPWTMTHFQRMIKGMLEILDGLIVLVSLGHLESDMVARYALIHVRRWKHEQEQQGEEKEKSS